MQNPHVKYLKTENTFYLFYYEHGNILCRHYAADGWTAPLKVAENTAPVFSLCQYRKKAHLLYHNINGQLIMATSTDLSGWEHNPISEAFKTAENTKFFLLPTDHVIHLIYHQLTESTGIDALVYTVFRDGKWEKPYQIDRFLPMQKSPFLARRLSQEHIILYYRTGRNIISAREMLLEPYTMGSVTPLIQTPSLCLDLSIVNDSEKIHMLYIVRGMFRSQVVYQYKHSSAISTPRILWEDNACENCLVFLQNNRLILMWTANGHPMRCVSENGGASFGSVEKYTDTFPAKCIKAELIGADSDLFNSTECYGDQQTLLPAVIPFQSPSPVSSADRRKILQTDPSKVCTILQESHRQQLEELSALLSQRSDEIAAVNAQWKKKTEQLQKELTALRQENALLKLKATKKEDV